MMGDLWNRLVKSFETARGSCDITRRTLSLGVRDSVTGWRVKSYVETTIKMVIIPRGATQSALKAGTYVRLDAVGLTDTLLSEGDEVKTSGGTYYKVKAVRNHSLTPDVVEYYEVDLTKLPLHV